MKTTFLHNQHNKDCILFFNGWGMDIHAVDHLDRKGFDVILFNDYNPINLFTEELNDYRKIYVVAWSLGVWAASRILSQKKFNIDKALAINGTLQPIDDLLGIPETIFNETLNSWSETSREKFNMRISGGRRQYERLNKLDSERTIENQKNELCFIRQEILKSITVPFPFNCALIGIRDLIFTSANQNNYWKDKTCIMEFDIPHYPFAAFKSWEEIIELQNAVN